MKKILVLLSILLTFSLNAIADRSDEKNDEKKDKKKKPIYYRLNQKFGTNVSHIYRMTEKTKVVRYYEDSSKYEYEREYTYFFKLRASSDYDSDGYQTIKVSIDSLHYYFKDKDAEFSTVTRLGVKKPKHYDLTKTFAINALEFQYRFSRYFDVAAISGEMIEWNREYVTNPRTAPRKEFNRELYQKRYSNETLKHLSDLGKNVLPAVEVEKDSVWTSELNLDINQTSFKGYVNSRMTSLRSESYMLESDINNMEIKDKKYRLEDLKKFATIDSSNIKGNMQYKLHFLGRFEFVEAKVKAILYGKVSAFNFREEIEQETVWDLLNAYRY